MISALLFGVVGFTVGASIVAIAFSSIPAAPPRDRCLTGCDCLRCRPLNLM
ncbi:MAG: hypothetical protein ACRDP3_22725 [Streptomyces sp.]|uniref:hypothetical protein n=1 Tax=Streptomyces sp. TaxID=1931 RepID=UPI003D6C2176